jgi:hypothetical protein
MFHVEHRVSLLRNLVDIMWKKGEGAIISHILQCFPIYGIYSFTWNNGRKGPVYGIGAGGLKALR